MHIVQGHVQVGVILIVMGVVTIAIQDVQVRVQIPAKMDVQIHVVIAREAVSITVLPVTVVVKDEEETAVAVVAAIVPGVPEPAMPVVGQRLPAGIFARGNTFLIVLEPVLISV